MTRYGLSAAFVIRVSGSTTPTWSPGPIPLPIPDEIIDKGFAARTTTDMAARAEYFNQTIHPALYGTGDRPARWHLSTDNKVGDAHVWALEILRPPACVGVGGEALAIVHTTFMFEPTRSLADFAHIGGRSVDSRREEIEALLPCGWRISVGSSKFRLVAFIDMDPSDPSDTQDRDLLLWQLATATTLSDYMPDERIISSCTQLSLSSDWSALVARNGVSFATFSPGSDFAKMARILVHSVYLDVLLLAEMQIGAVSHLSAAVVSRTLQSDNVPSLVLLERQMFEVRRMLWRTETGDHEHANSLLRAIQSVHRVRDQMESIQSDIALAARLAQSIVAERTNTTVTLVSLFGLPFGLAFSAAAIVPSNGWMNVIAASLVGLLVVGLLAILKPVRSMIRPRRNDGSL